MSITKDDATELPAEIADALAGRFTRIVVFSGAGMSEESGIATFRSAGNALWGQFRPEELATRGAWRHDKAKVWGWYSWRRGLVQEAEPNAGHRAVAQLQQDRGATVVTQNVDNLHERAGATAVLHLHGRLFSARCFACGEPQTLDVPGQKELKELMPPHCTRCNDYVRPDVVWFGETLPVQTLKQAKTSIRECDLLLVVGTSGVVQPAAGLVDFAPRSATIIEINPDARTATRGRQRLHWVSTAAVALPLIREALGTK